MDKPVLYMLCGLSGSGKSEYAKEFKKKSEELNSEYRVHIFSSDDLREELYGDTNDQSHNNELFNELHRRIKSCLKNGYDAIYDATNIKSKLRIAFLKELKNIPCHKVCLIIWRPYHECIFKYEINYIFGIDVFEKEMDKYFNESIINGTSLFNSSLKLLSTYV